MNKRNTFFAVMLTGCFISLLTFSCHNSYGSDGPGDQPMDFSETSYSKNYAMWNKKKPENYIFVLNGELQGNSEKAYEVQVTVYGKNNSIKFSEKTNISEEEDSLITSIEELFTAIKTVSTNTSSNYEKLLLSYNKKYGYPELFLYSAIQNDSKTATFKYIVKSFKTL